MGYDYRRFSFTDNGYTITQHTEKYSRTASDKSWKKKADSATDMIVTKEHYTNYITAIPFFNNFGGKASCRASWSYSYAGYLPDRVCTISPDGKTKIVATFDFRWNGDVEGK